MYHNYLLFIPDIVFADKDFRGFKTDIFVGDADAIHLVTDELAQLVYIAGVCSQVKQVEYRTQ